MISIDNKENEIHIYYNYKENINKVEDSNIQINKDCNENINENIQIHFYSDILHTMNRPLHESIDKTLKRMLVTFTKKMKTVTKKKISKNYNNDTDKQSNNKINELGDDVYIKLYDKLTNEIIDSSELTNNNWNKNMLLSIHNKKYDIIINPPTISQISIFNKKILMVGYPIVPLVEIVFADELLTTYHWYKCSQSSNEYVYISNDKIYTPNTEDIDYQLKLFVTAYTLNEDNCRISGRSTVIYLPGVVYEGPVSTSLQRNMIDTRESYMNTSIVNGLRVITYNILADPYATTDMYPYCQEKFLITEYRCQLIYKELLNYKADIICLQECDFKSYEIYFKPLFQLSNYFCHYTNKSNEVREGCSTFINNHKMITHGVIDLYLQDLILSDHSLLNFFNLRVDIKECINKLGMIAQVSICEIIDGSHEKKIILISNTHLFYHPLAAYIRLLQTDCIIKIVTILSNYVKSNGLNDILYINEIKSYNDIQNIVDINNFYNQMKKCSLDHNELSDYIITECDNAQDDWEVITTNDINRYHTSIIFCGDLNSTKKNPVIEFLEKGIIEQNHHVWSTINDFQWNPRTNGKLNNKKMIRSNQNCINNLDVSTIIPVLKHSFNLVSSAGYPKYTNFTAGFKDTLDYIYVSANDFTVVTIAPFPNDTELGAYTALPSPLYPSDHMSIAVDIEFKQL